MKYYDCCVLYRSILFYLLCLAYGYGDLILPDCDNDFYKIGLYGMGALAPFTWFILVAFLFGAFIRFLRGKK